VVEQAEVDDNDVARSGPEVGVGFPGQGSDRADDPVELLLVISEFITCGLFMRHVEAGRSILVPRVRQGQEFVSGGPAEGGEEAVMAGAG
jgi:hypothetical protein